MKRSSCIALALAAAVFAAPLSAHAQEASARKGAEGRGAEPKKPSKKYKAKRSFKRDEPAAEDRGAPSTTENTLTVRPNVPGTGEDEPVMRGGGERPDTN